MHNQIIKLVLFVFFAVAAFSIISCAGMISEKEQSEREFIESLEWQIDQQITPDYAYENLEKARGKIAKWHGNIREIWNDKIYVCRKPLHLFNWDIGPPFDPYYIDPYENFVVLLDHPLPNDFRITKLKQAVLVGDAIWIIGRVSDEMENIIVNEANIQVSVLTGYAISKVNDQYFQRPAWVSKNNLSQTLS